MPLIITEEICISFYRQLFLKIAQIALQTNRLVKYLLFVLPFLVLNRAVLYLPSNCDRPGW